jgi:mycothiol synthase
VDETSTIETSTLLRTRPLRYADDGTVDAADLATAVRLVAECDIAAIGERDSGDDDIAGMLLMPTLDRSASALVLDGDDALGFLFVENDVTGRDSFLEIYCPPGPRRREVNELGIRLGLEAARRHRAAAPDAQEWTARSGCWAGETDYAEVLEAAGFTPSRNFHRMRIESTSPLIPAEMPPLPEGVDVEVVRDEAGARRLCALDNASFAEHYNFVPREFDEWWALMSVGTTRDPDGWWLLTVDGVDAAMCLLDESRAALGDGYVGVLGVLEQFRGRGLAQLLLRRAFVRYRDLGRAGTQLGVDADNTTGAVRLYERVGMRVTRSVTGYSRPIA